MAAKQEKHQELSQSVVSFVKKETELRKGLLERMSEIRLTLEILYGSGKDIPINASLITDPTKKGPSWYPSEGVLFEEFDAARDWVTIRHTKHVTPQGEGEKVYISVSDIHKTRREITIEASEKGVIVQAQVSEDKLSEDMRYRVNNFNDRNSGLPGDRLLQIGQANDTLTVIERLEKAELKRLNRLVPAQKKAKK